MPTAFDYRVRDIGGQMVTGSLEADSAVLVARKLREMGYVPVSVTKHSAGMRTEIHIPGLSNRVKLKEVAVFSRQFATMINSGIALTRGLAILAEQATNTVLSRTIDQVRIDVENGESLSQAMAKRPKIFSNLYVSMVRAGETGGSLDSALLDLARALEKQVELRQKVRSAMTYPVVVIALVLLILSAMLLFVVPVFKKMYAELNGKLPLMTRMLIAASSDALRIVPVLLVLVVAGVFAYRRIVRTPRGRLAVDRLKLRIPIFGPLAQKAAMSRFASTMSTLLASGVPLLEGLDIVSDTVANAVVAQGVASIGEGARQGEPLTKNLADHPVFPSMVRQMMAVGEETGALDALLSKVATFYDQEVQAAVDSLTSILEPLLIMVLGGTVGSMVIALYLPMFDIIKLVNQ